VGNNQPVFIIAEAGINYNNKLSLAYKMVDKAIDAGVDAIKFRTFITSLISSSSNDGFAIGTLISSNIISENRSYIDFFNTHVYGIVNLKSVNKFVD